MLPFGNAVGVVNTKLVGMVKSPMPLVGVIITDGIYAFANAMGVVSMDWVDTNMWVWSN